MPLRGQAVLLFACCFWACHRAGPAQKSLLTTVGAVRQLSQEEASARPRVRISGTVTVVDGFTQIMFIQDRTGAVWAALPPALANVPGGSAIELSGTAVAIGQDRAIIYPSIQKVGPGTQPARRQITRTDLLAGRKNYALGRLHARVKQTLTSAGQEIRFSAEMAGGPVEVSLLHAPSGDFGDFVGQEVDLDGVPAPPTLVSTAGMPLFLADDLALSSGSRPKSNPLRLLTTIREVKALSLIEAQRSYPVELHGVITTSAQRSYMLTVQDDTGAIYLNLDTRFQFPPFGHRVRVEGVTSAGQIAPTVAVSKVVAGDRAPMPASVDLARHRTSDPDLDNRWVHLDGVVRSVSTDPVGGYSMVVATPQFRTIVPVLSGTAAEAAQFVPGTAIALDGTYSPTSDRFSHWRDFRIFTPSFRGIRIRSSTPGHAVQARAVTIPLRNLFDHGTVSSPTVPIGIRGVVTLSAPDGSIYVSDGQGGVQVVSVAGSKPVGPGTLVEITGFLPIDPLQRRIEDATWKIIGASPAPEALVIQPESALDASFESRWVRLEGVLTHRQQAIEYNILALQSASVLVNVYSAAAPDAAWEALRMGSTLMVRGIVLPELGRTGLTGSRTVSILVGSSKDIQVVRMASWWTPEHLTATLVVASVLLLVLLLLASLLVRRVWTQARTIGKKLEVEAALKLEAQAASRAKSQFLASMSHEIRTPMNGILGLTRLALRTAGEPERTGYLNDVLQSAESLMGILNDVLDLAKIETGKVTFNEGSFSLFAMLRPIAAAARAQCEAMGVQFVCNVAPDVPDMVVGDPMRLRQVVVNLVSNACKFTHTGKVEVDASIEATGEEIGKDKERFTLIVHVRDTGIGIAPEQIGMIFGAFEQADRSDSRRYGGTGLGLAICRNLTRLMGGEIQVASKLNEGSDFRICVPMRRAPLPDVSKSSSAPSPERFDQAYSAFRPLRILAAEDNRINRILLGRILEQAGHQAVFAGDGAETLRLWEQDVYDLLLMDLQMPVMDGLETAKEIRRREAPIGRRTPIIAVTARAMHEDRDLTAAAGMDGYVSKPYSQEDILAAIERVLPASNGKPRA